jgi:hypothetical protein
MLALALACTVPVTVRAPLTTKSTSTTTSSTTTPTVATTPTSSSTGTSATTGTTQSTSTVIPTGSPWMGLDVGRPIDPYSGDVVAQIDPVAIAASGAGWVRVNFVLGPWSSPEDTTPHGALGLSWEETYRQIVDGFVGQGLQVYGLVGAELVASPDPVGSDAWLDAYTYNVVAAVDRFKDDVRVYETYNEPNNWVAPNTPALAPDRYALLLQDVYLAVKHDAGHDADPAWQVTLISGPLFSHDLDTAATYLDDTMWYGHDVWAWDWTSQYAGSTPFDGIGYHLYVAQGSTSAYDIAPKLDENLSAVQGVLDAWEPGSGKQIWVSEMGWSSDAVGEDGQADALDAAYDTLRGDPRLALVTWFTYADFPGGPWGLKSDPATTKPAWDRFVDQAAIP